MTPTRPTPTRPTRRKLALPRWRKGAPGDFNGWTGGDSFTLYAFTDKRTGRVVVSPGKYVSTTIGGECTVAVATRDQAIRLWQNPLHPAWKVKD